MSTLKKPLFINGMYNREGKNCRADFVREVSNGAQSFRLWMTTEKKEYPQNEYDEFWLYVEANNYLVPVNLTEWNLVKHLGFVQLYRITPQGRESCTKSPNYVGRTAQTLLCRWAKPCEYYMKICTFSTETRENAGFALDSYATIPTPQKNYKESERKIANVKRNYEHQRS